MKFIGGPNLKVLDVGCGDGAISELIHNNGNECWGMDLPDVVTTVPSERRAWLKAFGCDASEKAWIPHGYGVFGGEVHMLGDRGPGGIIYGSNIEPVPSEFFDAIFAGEIIEHMLDLEPFLT